MCTIIPISYILHIYYMSNVPLYIYETETWKIFGKTFIDWYN